MKGPFKLNVLSRMLINLIGANHGSASTQASLSWTPVSSCVSPSPSVTHSHSQRHAIEWLVNLALVSNSKWLACNSSVLKCPEMIRLPKWVATFKTGWGGFFSILTASYSHQCFVHFVFSSSVANCPLWRVSDWCNEVFVDSKLVLSLSYILCEKLLPWSPEVCISLSPPPSNCEAIIVINRAKSVNIFYGLGKFQRRGVVTIGYSVLHPAFRVVPV